MDFATARALMEQDNEADPADPWRVERYAPPAPPHIPAAVFPFHPTPPRPVVGSHPLGPDTSPAQLDNATAHRQADRANGS